MQRMKYRFFHLLPWDKSLYTPFKMFTNTIYQHKIPVTRTLILPFLCSKSRTRVCHTLHFDKLFSRVDKTTKSKFFDTHISSSKSISQRWSDTSTNKRLIEGYFKWFIDHINHSLLYQKILQVDDPFNRLRTDWLESVYSHLSTISTVFQDWFNDVWIDWWLFMQ